MGHIFFINILDITNITTSLANTSSVMQMFFMSLGTIILMLPIAKYLVYLKDMRDWRILTLITEMGLEEQDLRNQMAEDFVYSCEQLADMDEAQQVATNMITKLQQDLSLLQELLEEEQATVYALQTQVAKLSRGAKAKRPSNVMPMLTKNVERESQGFNLFHGNPLPMEYELES